MEFADRLGLAALMVTLVGLGITILWPTKRWLGYLSLIAGIGLALWWGRLEYVAKYKQVPSVHPAEPPKVEKPSATKKTPRRPCTPDNQLQDCSDQQIIDGIVQVNHRIQEITVKRSQDFQRSVNSGIPQEQSRSWAEGIADRDFLSCCFKDAALYRHAAINRLGPGFRDEENNHLYDEESKEPWDRTTPWAYKALYIKRDLEEIAAKLAAKPHTN